MVRGCYSKHRGVFANCFPADVFQSGDPSEDVVTRWLSAYNEDNFSALADLVNLVLRCAGCSIGITSDDVNDEDNVMNKLIDIQEEHQAVSRPFCKSHSLLTRRRKISQTTLSSRKRRAAMHLETLLSDFSTNSFKPCTILEYSTMKSH